MVQLNAVSNIARLHCMFISFIDASASVHKNNFLIYNISNYKFDFNQVGFMAWKRSGICFVRVYYYRPKAKRESAAIRDVIVYSG